MRPVVPPQRWMQFDRKPGFPFTATLAVAGGCLKIYLHGWKTQMCLIRLGSYDVGKPPPIVPLTWSFGGVLHFQTDPHGGCVIEHW